MKEHQEVPWPGTAALLGHNKALRWKMELYPGPWGVPGVTALGCAGGAGAGPCCARRNFPVL